MFVILRLTEETWRSVVSLLQVSKPCYSYALETKHMFSSRLLREPTCYLYPVSGRREMTALSSLAFFLSKLPLIKRLKQSVTFSPPHIIRRCTAMAPVCVCVFVFVCVCVCARARACCICECQCACVPDASPLYKEDWTSELSALDDNRSKSKARHTCDYVRNTKNMFDIK